MGRLISTIGAAGRDATSVPFALRRAATARHGVLRVRRMAACVGLCALLGLAGCDESEGVGPRFADIGNAERGALYIEQIGCGSCHVIPGIDGARGLVGPPLDYMGKRVFIAGLLRNTPANMMTWLRDPQEVVPGNAMPDMGLSEEQARDITAYLYTLD
jgi:cytochrome c